ncbi:hypothetical protein I317_02541 [Kwoniella heveanensis CBS 569]|nr:hypothetical protein I317_02541 [Kwoniella heveanensis CBS 569]
MPSQPSYPFPEDWDPTEEEWSRDALSSTMDGFFQYPASEDWVGNLSSNTQAVTTNMPFPPHSESLHLPFDALDSPSPYVNSDRAQSPWDSHHYPMPATSSSLTVYSPTNADTQSVGSTFLNSMSWRPDSEGRIETQEDD